LISTVSEVTTVEKSQEVACTENSTVRVTTAEKSHEVECAANFIATELESTDTVSSSVHHGEINQTRIGASYAGDLLQAGPRNICQLVLDSADMLEINIIAFMAHQDEKGLLLILAKAVQAKVLVGKVKLVDQNRLVGHNLGGSSEQNCKSKTN
jgi:hypothetical protein